VSLRLGQIVEALGGVLHGSPDLTIDRLSPLDSAGSQSLSFLSNPRYVAQLAATRAACVIVGPDQARTHKPICAPGLLPTSLIFILPG